MRFKKWLLLFAVLPMFCWGSPGSSGPVANNPLSGDNVTYVLFGGSDVDSTEQASYWIPVGFARRVIIRTWTSKAAFHASTDADSTYSDSLITFKIAWSDSVQATEPFAAADSVLIDYTVSLFDTAFTNTGARPLPINKQLRAPSNGSGLMTVVFPTSAPTAGGTAVTVHQQDPGGFITKKFMRVRVTPLRRMTVTGSQSTAGKRVNGLKGLRMWATVVK